MFGEAFPTACLNRLCGRGLPGVLLGGFLLATGNAAVADDGYGDDDFTFRLRPAVWAVFMSGEYEATNTFGNNITVSVTDDLGYESTYPSFYGDANLRFGNHDIWLTSSYVNASEGNAITFNFTIDDIQFDLGGTIDTDVRLLDVNLGYGYSFFNFEEDGFRFGPVVAVSYTDVKIELTELTVLGIPTGEQAEFHEILPVPTLGVYTEVPFCDFVFAGKLTGLYADWSNVEILGVRGEAGLTWRPFENFGIFGGISAIYADLKIENTDIDDLVFWGPTLGVEIRF